MFPYKTWNLLNILRVSRLETRLTVYRALYIHNTEAVWAPHGVYVPAAIGTLDNKKDRKLLKAQVQFPKRFVQLQQCICMLFMAEVVLKNIWILLTYSPIQIFMIDSQINDFSKI